MKSQNYTVITGSGSYIPTRRVLNEDFIGHLFYDENGTKVSKPTAEIIEKLEKISGIRERRYVTDDLVASDIAFLAAEDALISSGTDPESLDGIIVAHNFGDIRADNRKSEFVPALASRVKHRFKIANPSTLALDLPFGCAGWLQGVIQADQLLKSGSAKKIMVIGAETLSRVCDPHDRDSMIYSDGAGAVILESIRSKDPVGILASTVKSYTDDFAYLIRMGGSSNPEFSGNMLFLKMNGHRLYESILKTVPGMIKETLEKAEFPLSRVDKFLIHQANEKMDEAVLRQLFSLHDLPVPSKNLLPMTISWLGNSSVATLPTMYDLMLKGRLENHAINPGKYLILAAMGAGVNMNSILYKVL
ncbi:ketoacyl-ACP synthase III [Ravibacter arvi]|uniref:Ketoacyl-ACP synthase III n=1 Tax=Ravibacter arvi TaxID=2051041 RepID=A0ABP8LM42_9BACT